MRAVLTSKIPVHLVEVFAEMAWMERRPELGLLCRAARQDGNRIGPPVVQSALPGLSDTGAKNVIAWCRFLGLCDAGGAVTALGEQVAQRDEAPVPEQGVYGLWLANHPVIGRRVLAVERLSSSRAHRNEQMKPLDVAPELGTVFRSVVAPRSGSWCARCRRTTATPRSSRGPRARPVGSAGGSTSTRGGSSGSWTERSMRR